MATNYPITDSIRAAKRRAIAARRIGIGARCAYCGESRPQALIRNSDPMICTECKRKAEGHTIYDQHHIAGKGNCAVTVSVRANDHRTILSEAQQDWPKETRENPEQSPLRMAAAFIRGFVDTVKYWMDKFLLSIAALLEWLDDRLAEWRGPTWWTHDGFMDWFVGIMKGSSR